MRTNRIVRRPRLGVLRRSSLVAALIAVAGCGVACPVPAHGSAKCDGGKCAVAQCDPGFQDCDGMIANGCESDTTSDVAHCGSCKGACPTAANTTISCVKGVCGIDHCSDG